MKVIVVTGSVCSGKTTLSKVLAKSLKYSYVDVAKLIKDNNLRGRYLKNFKTYEVNVTKLNKFLISFINKSKTNLVIDSHLSHYLPKQYVDLCVICKCSVKELRKRLKSRKYTKIKIEENLESEIMDVCYNEALENKHKLVICDTSKSNIKKCLEIVGNYK